MLRKWVQLTLCWLYIITKQLPNHIEFLAKSQVCEFFPKRSWSNSIYWLRSLQSQIVTPVVNRSVGSDHPWEPWWTVTPSFSIHPGKYELRKTNREPLELDETSSTLTPKMWVLLDVVGLNFAGRGLPLANDTCPASAWESKCMPFWQPQSLHLIG